MREVAERERGGKVMKESFLRGFLLQICRLISRLNALTFFLSSARENKNSIYDKIRFDINFKRALL